MSDNYSEYSFLIEDITVDQANWLQDQITNNLEAYNTDPDFEIDVDDFGDIEDTADGLWLHSEYGFNDCLAELLKAYLAKFRPDETIIVQWAEYCSSPKLDSFGGGACIITPVEIKYLVTSSWLDEQVKKMNKSNPQSINDLWDLDKGETCIRVAIGKHFGGDDGYDVRKLVNAILDKSNEDYTVSYLDAVNDDSDQAIYVADASQHLSCKEMAKLLESSALHLYNTFCK